MKFKFQPFLLALFISLQFSYAQHFVDDLYFSDSEVDYSFLYINPTNEINDDNLYYDDENWDDENWDDDLTYENRIRKFHNHYNFHHYWDYGWHNPSWYNWNYPSYWSWSLNYHNYGWGSGFNYSLGWNHGWNNPYAYNYGWQNPYTYGYGMSHHHHYWPSNYYPGAYGAWGHDYFIISNENINVSYGHRNSQNTNIRDNTNLGKEREINTTNQRPQKNNINQISKSKNEKKGKSGLGHIINNIITHDNSTKNKNYQSKNKNNKSSINRSSRSGSSRSGSSRGRN